MAKKTQTPQQLIGWLEYEYKLDLKDKLRTLIAELKLKGEETAKLRYASAKYSMEYKSKSSSDEKDIEIVEQDVRKIGENFISGVVVIGKNLGFIEFGAGITHGTSGYSSGMRTPAWVGGPGSYGKGQGVRRGWGYYTADGGSRVTQGNPPALIMHHVSKRIQGNIVRDAKRIYRTRVGSQG